MMLVGRRLETYARLPRLLSMVEAQTSRHSELDAVAFNSTFRKSVDKHVFSVGPVEKLQDASVDEFTNVLQVRQEAILFSAGILM